MRMMSSCTFMNKISRCTYVAYARMIAKFVLLVLVVNCFSMSVVAKLVDKPGILNLIKVINIDSCYLLRVMWIEDPEADNRRPPVSGSRF